MMANISVLIVDDSALVRKLLTEILESDPHIDVVGTAMDPYQARDKIKLLKPDVITLDVEMPKMDGVSFLRNLMRLHPKPVVMISTLTEGGAKVTLDALEFGAVDFVAKPKLDLKNSLNDYSDEIIRKVKAAAKVNVNALEQSIAPSVGKLTADAIIKKNPTGSRPLRTSSSRKIVAIGSSTGGTEAIKTVLQTLPAGFPSIVITQHIPIAFSQSFAERVDSVSNINVCQAEDGQEILAGTAYIAPGDKHLLIERSGSKYFCRLNDGPPVSRHKPSVDVMFRSVAQSVGANAIGVMLTGMGDDGAEGMLEMKEAGATNFVQDENSCVVWGMPGSAVKAGAATEQIPLQKIAAKLIKLVND
jgi:two-component system chemotaxis response regulator CheB